jgi:flavin reductase (DIM6/NTAB) family NADH-FMN oxidoreductase RutF
MTELIEIHDPVEALKSTFRRHASGVAIITTVDTDGSPIGFTATSVTSLGATPPLVSFNVARGSSSWHALSTATHVAIHTLGEENLELAKRMADDHTKRFAADDWKTGVHGLPIFENTTSVLVVRVLQIVTVENNAVMIGAVESGLLGVEQSALLYHQRAYVAPGKTLS